MLPRVSSFFIPRISIGMPLWIECEWCNSLKKLKVLYFIRTAGIYLNRRGESNNNDNLWVGSGILLKMQEWQTRGTAIVFEIKSFYWAHLLSYNSILLCWIECGISISMKMCMWMIFLWIRHQCLSEKPLDTFRTVSQLENKIVAN